LQSITDYEPDYVGTDIAPVKLIVESYKRTANGTMAQYTETKNYSLTLDNPYGIYFPSFFFSLLKLLTLFNCLRNFFLILVSGPFEGPLSKVKELLQAMTNMQQLFSLTDTGMLADFGLTEFKWNIRVHYKSDGGRVAVGLDLTKVWGREGDSRNKEGVRRNTE
jgi:hypothetical protein